MSLKLLALGGLLSTRGLCAEDPGSVPGGTLFAAPFHRLQLAIASDAMGRLRKAPREFVSATVSDSTNTYTNVAIHLKGSTGSFRPVDAKPSFTLDFCRFEDGRKFHGLRRIHLNNSVEDPSLLNEKLATELFGAAGVPAPRVTFARVTLNGRELGIYVLKEGFTEDFLSCHFRRLSGELYQPKDGYDVDLELDRLSLQAPRLPRSLLPSLAEATRESDPVKRWPRLETVVDMDRFLPFAAMEVMLGHRDGYCLARNNFRVYCDPETEKILFFPHGMDQLLGTADLSWQPGMAGLVTQAVLEAPEGKQRYEACFRSLFTNVFRVQVLTHRVDDLGAQLRPFLSAEENSVLSREAALLKDRITRRHASLKSQLAQPPSIPLVFQHGVAKLNDEQKWSPIDARPGVRMDRVTGRQGVRSLQIRTKAESAASWRARDLLARGRYSFEGRARTEGFEPLPFGTHQGAALRIAGVARPHQTETGGPEWSTYRAEFEVKQERELVEFVCEFRAKAGTACFDLESLQVRQVSEE